MARWLLSMNVQWFHAAADDDDDDDDVTTVMTMTWTTSALSSFHLQ